MNYKLQCTVASYIDACLFYILVNLRQLSDPVENDNNQNSGTDNNTNVVAIASLVILSVVLIICVIVLTIFVFKFKLQLQAISHNKRYDSSYVTTFCNSNM